MREIRTLRATGRGLEMELRNGLRHRHDAKAAGNRYSPFSNALAPAPDPTDERVLFSSISELEETHEQDPDCPRDELPE